MKSQLLISACLRAPTATRCALRAYLRCVGFIPDGAEWAVNALQEQLSRPLPPRVVRTSTGSHIRADFSTSTGRDLYFRGTTEPRITRFLRRALRRGMTAIDGGANIGELSVAMGRFVGPSGTVLAVEPSPASREALVANIALNKLSAVRVIPAALAQNSGFSRFYLDRHAHSGAASLFSPHRSAHTIMVRTTTIDDLADALSLRQIDLIKLDVEGAELEVLLGARRILSSASKPLLILEYNSHVAARAGWSVQNLTRILVECGYNLYELTPQGALKRMTTPSDFSADRDLCKYDVIALPRSSDLTRCRALRQAS